MKSIKYSLISFLFVIGMAVSTQNDVLAATATVDTSEVHQTMEGFGASVAWEVWQLYSHAEKTEVYNYLFKELGMDILRLRNIYGKPSESYIFGLYGEIVDSFYSLSENEPKVLISSWTPPVDLKSNDNLVGGTLKDDGGEYLYGDFTQYWVDALDEFAGYGIVPDYISIQNEPDWYQSNPTCRLDPTENDTMAGYDQALDSVYLRLQGLSSPPMILAPEVLGIGYNHFQNHASQFNHDHADGYAYHLYHGGDGNVNPDAFNSNLTAIANSYTGKPIFQTEYDKGGWFNTAWLIHNCLVYGNVSGYLYWWSVCSFSTEWPPLIKLDGSTSYTINQEYWAIRQYSKAIHYGWKRVGASVDADSIKISAFLSPGNDELSIVILNVSHSEDSVDLADVSGFDISGANMLRTSDTENSILAGYYDGSTVNLPARSITTISTMYIAGIEDKNNKDLNTVDCYLSQNYPNPFSTATTIEYSIAKAGFVKLSIYDVTGREVEILVDEMKPAGSHAVNFDADGLSQGVYFYKLTSGGNSAKKKMILIK